MQEAWVAFAKDPIGGLACEGWSRYTKLGTDKVRDFGREVAAQDVSLMSMEAMCDGASQRL